MRIKASIRLFPFHRPGFYFLIVFLASTRLVDAQNPDSLWVTAQLAAANRNFDEAYLLYEKSGQVYLEKGEQIRYLRCRVEMARSSQFTSIVSREVIKEIIDPAIKLIAQTESLEATREAAECYQFLARYHWAIKGDYDAALEEYQTAINICETIGDSANQEKMAAMADLSHVYSNREEFDEALKYASNSLRLSQEIYGKDHVENGPRYFNLGFTYYRKGHYDRAITEITRGIEILKKNDGQEMQIGLGYNNLSAVYVAQLDQEGARQSSLAAEEIFSKFLGPDHEAIGLIEWDLGVMYLDLKKYQTALGHLIRAKDIFETNFGPSFPQLPQLYHQIGQCHDHLDQFVEAESWHQKAFQVNLVQYGDVHVRTGESFRNLAQHYLVTNQLDKAHQAITAGLKITRNPENQSDLLRAWLYEQMGIYLSKTGDYVASSQAFDTATLAICFTGTELAKLTVEKTFNPLFFAEYQHQKSHSSFKAYQQASATSSLREALDAARLAHQGIRTLRLSYQSAAAKLFLQERARSHYELMMDILYELWQQSAEETYLHEAWKISEETKSLLLLEEIKTSNIVFHDIPSVVIDTIKILKQDLAFYEQAVFQHLESGNMEAVRDNQSSYLETTSKIQLYQQKIQQEYPQYRSIFQDMATTELKDIQEALNENTVLIEYFVGDTSLYSFGLSSHQVVWSKNQPKDLDLALKQLIEESRDLEKIIDNPTQALSTYQALSAKVFNLLFSDALVEQIKSVDKLIIIPDQQLAYLSFEALNPNTTSDYLIEEYAITYAYSGSLWHLHNQQAKSIALANFGGFAPSYDAIDDTLSDNALAMLYRSGDFNLPGAKQEILSIQDRISGDAWVDDQATETVFKLHAPEYNILHLSLHGLMNQEEPMKSRLLFYRDGDESGELNAYEIYNLPLKADLAVLSACNTATGALQSGEGILSLSRAFAYAGVPNLIASLWRADDAASSQIMIKFYEGLSKKRTKDEALREAKLAFLSDQKSETYRHPYFWSPYILIGENVSHFTIPIQWHWWLLGVGVSCCLLFYILLRKK